MPLPAPVALLERFRLQSAARSLLPLEGVAGCLRRRQSGKDMVDLWYLPEASRARFGGLQTCCSVWACPVCSAKITERRRVEVREAIDAWNSLNQPLCNSGWHPPLVLPDVLRGGEVVMASFTVRHKSTDKLKELVRGLRRALGRLSAGKQGQKLRSEFGVMGMVRSVEVTWGEENGFHPHVHMLIFVKPSCPFDLLWLHLRKQWNSALRLEGMRDVTERGVDLRWANEDSADYVTKNSWDIEHEIAKGPMKVGRKDSLTPPQLLRLHADNPVQPLDKETGEMYRVSRWGALWREYAHEMKGVRQLQWTPGFRASLGLIKEKTDEVLAEETDNLGILLARLDKKEWATVLYFDARADLLNVAASGDTLEVKSFLFDLDCRFTSAKEELDVKHQDRRRTEWDDQKEADADEMGLTRAEYLAWRSSGAAALVNDAPAAPADPPAALPPTFPDGWHPPLAAPVVKGNLSTLRALMRRTERDGLAMIEFEKAVGPLRWGNAPAFCLPETLERVEPSEPPDPADEPRNGFSQRFASIS